MKAVLQLQPITLFFLYPVNPSMSRAREKLWNLVYLNLNQALPRNGMNPLWFQRQRRTQRPSGPVAVNHETGLMFKRQYYKVCCQSLT